MDNVNITRIGIVLLLPLVLMAGCGFFETKSETCTEKSLCIVDTSVEPSVKGFALGEQTKEDLVVCGCNPWTSSGIAVCKNQHYEVTLTDTRHWKDGEVNSNPVDGWEESKFVGWLGQRYKRSNKTGWYALTGSIDKDDETTFPVLFSESEPNTITIPKDGTLYFYANDMMGRYFNNFGYVTLKIKRIDDAANDAKCEVEKEASR
jgi:hypothetical protein